MTPSTIALVCSSPDGEPNNARIQAFAFDDRGGTFTPLASTPHDNNPTFLTIDAARRLVFVAGESQQSMVSSYRANPADGSLELLSAQPTLGDYAAHVMVDAAGGSVFATNYGGPVDNSETFGAVAYPVGPDGKLGDRFWGTKFTGSGPVKGRQETTHPHSSLLSPDQKTLVVPELGGDRLFCYAFDAAHRTVTPAAAPVIAMPPGSGPRHARFSANGRYLYVAMELSSQVIVLDLAASAPIVQTISTLPSDFAGTSYPSELQMNADGTRLYVANRGHESVARFAVDPASGRLTFLGTTPLGGSWPRHFAIDPSGRFLTVANQKTHELLVFAIDPTSGDLTETGRLAIAQPMCIKFACFAA